MGNYVGFADGMFERYEDGSELGVKIKVEGKIGTRGLGYQTTDLIRWVGEEISSGEEEWMRASRKEDLQ